MEIFSSLSEKIGNKMNPVHNEISNDIRRGLRESINTKFSNGIYRGAIVRGLRLPETQIFNKIRGELNRKTTRDETR